MGMSQWITVKKLKWCRGMVSRRWWLLNQTTSNISFNIDIRIISILANAVAGLKKWVKLEDFLKGY